MDLPFDSPVLECSARSHKPLASLDFSFETSRPKCAGDCAELHHGVEDGGGGETVGLDEDRDGNRRNRRLGDEKSAFVPLEHRELTFAHPIRAPGF
jgi:hypothetical protein